MALPALLLQSQPCWYFLPLSWLCLGMVSLSWIYMDLLQNYDILVGQNDFDGPEIKKVQITIAAVNFHQLPVQLDLPILGWPTKPCILTR